MIKVILNGEPMFFKDKEEAYTNIFQISKGYKISTIENTRCCYALAMLSLGLTDINCLSARATEAIEVLFG